MHKLAALFVITIFAGCVDPAGTDEPTSSIDQNELATDSTTYYGHWMICSATCTTQNQNSYPTVTHPTNLLICVSQISPTSYGYPGLCPAGATISNQTCAIVTATANSPCSQTTYTPPSSTVTSPGPLPE
jgi:hypothetical protein